MKLEKIIKSIKKSSNYNPKAVERYARSRIDHIDLKDGLIQPKNHFKYGNGPFAIKNSFKHVKMNSGISLYQDLYHSKKWHIDEYNKEKLYRDEFTEDKFEIENVKHDFKGMYIFILKSEPIYIGISRNVITRLKQHLESTIKNQASLAYKIGTRHFKIEDHVEAIIEAQKCLRKCKIKLIRFYSDDVLYVSEVLASLDHNTPFNSFKTT